jgi:hypothetical protein
VLISKPQVKMIVFTRNRTSISTTQVISYSVEVIGFLEERTLHSVMGLVFSLFCIQPTIVRFMDFQGCIPSDGYWILYC